MRRSSVLLAVLLVLPACSAEGGTGTTTAGPSATTTTGATVTTIDLATTMASGFPVTVEADNGSCSPRSGSGLAHALRAFEGDSDQAAHQLVELVVDDPAPVCHRRRLPITRQLHYHFSNA